MTKLEKLYSIIENSKDVGVKLGKGLLEKWSVTSGQWLVIGSRFQVCSIKSQAVTIGQAARLSAEPTAYHQVSSCRQSRRHTTGSSRQYPRHKKSHKKHYLKHNYS